jgi:hypothetical protein
MKKFRTILFPIFSLGHGMAISAMMVIIAMIAIYDDLQLALYLAVGIYLGIVIATLLLGLAPDQVRIHEGEIGPISTLLDSEPLLSPIGDRIWAPPGYRSRLWKSDWISINETEGNKFVLKARKRDLKIILSEIRPRKAG